MTAACPELVSEQMVMLRNDQELRRNEQNLKARELAIRDKEASFLAQNQAEMLLQNRRLTDHLMVVNQFLMRQQRSSTVLPIESQELPKSTPEESQDQDSHTQGPPLSQDFRGFSTQGVPHHD